MAHDKKSKKKEIDTSRLEKLLNKYPKKKTLSKPSLDLMNQINKRVQNIHNKSKSKNVIQKPPVVPPIKPKAVKKKKTKSPKIKEVDIGDVNENLIAQEMEDMLKKEDERKKEVIKNLTVQENIKQDFLDTFNISKEKPPINKIPPVKLPKKSRRKILNDVRNNNDAYHGKEVYKSQKNDNILHKVLDAVQKKRQNKQELPPISYKASIKEVQKSQPKKRAKKPKSAAPKATIKQYQDPYEQLFGNTSLNQPYGQSYNQPKSYSQPKTYNQRPKSQSVRPNSPTNYQQIIPNELKSHITPDIVKSNPYIKRDLKQRYKHEQQLKQKMMEQQRQREIYEMKKQLYEETERRKRLERQQYEMYQKVKNGGHQSQIASRSRSQPQPTRSRSQPQPTRGRSQSTRSRAMSPARSRAYNRFSKRHPKYTFKEPTNTMDVYYKPRYKNPVNPNFSYQEPKTSDMVKTITISGSNSNYINKQDNSTSFNQNNTKPQKPVNRNIQQQKDRYDKANVQARIAQMIEDKRNRRKRVSDIDRIVDDKPPDIKSILLNLASKNSIDEIKDEINKLTNKPNNQFNTTDNQINVIKNKIMNGPIKIVKAEDNSSQVIKPIVEPPKPIPIVQPIPEPPKPLIDNKNNVIDKSNVIDKPNAKKRKRRSRSKSEDVEQKIEKPIEKQWIINKRRVFKDFTWEKRLCFETINLANKRSWKNHKLVSKNRKIDRRYKLNGSINLPLADVPGNIDIHKLLDVLVYRKIINLKDRFRNIPDYIFVILYQLLDDGMIKIKYQN